MGFVVFSIVAFVVCVGGGYLLGKVAGKILTYFFNDED
jgi:hypothetical protein